MKSNVYETDRLLTMYLLFHYGSETENLPYGFGPREALNFPQRCVDLCREALGKWDGSEGPRALDLGCSVGRSTFEIARFCKEVVGMDASLKFVNAAQRLKERGFIEYRKAEEGRLTSPVRAVVPKEVERSRVTFEQGDACRLRADLGTFDIVLAANLIDRLREPQKCLQQLPLHLRSGGVLAIVSPYTWMEEFTPPEQWLGGFERDGKLIRTFDTLRGFLEPSCSLITRMDMPFLMREHARRFEWGVADATVWKRKATV